ncbi:MAG: hypothetical protein HYV62_02855 [Candidatus Rokubacteria bacterium]|nr:hypothetical protein [Candidatus Rokubacteria bacterium]
MADLPVERPTRPFLPIHSAVGPTVVISLARPVTGFCRAVGDILGLEGGEAEVRRKA